MAKDEQAVAITEAGDKIASALLQISQALTYIGHYLRGHDQGGGGSVPPPEPPE